ncbi:MAG: hypothetical protein R3E95_12280 [Thiolinea sp.]
MNDVLKIVGKRLGLGLLTLLAVSIIIFGAVELLPGDLAEAVLGQGPPRKLLRPCARNWDWTARLRYAISTG